MSDANLTMDQRLKILAVRYNTTKVEVQKVLLTIALETVHDDILCQVDFAAPGKRGRRKGTPSKEAQIADVTGDVHVPKVAQ